MNRFNGIPVAIALGLLEAAWTGPGRGAPTNTWLGVFAILIVLLVTTWPRPWWIPALAILEEGTHLFVGYGWALPTWNTLLHHWSTGFIGFNIYPWITLPLLSLAGFFIFRRLRILTEPTER